MSALCTRTQASCSGGAQSPVRSPTATCDVVALPAGIRSAQRLMVPAGWEISHSKREGVHSHDL